MNHYIKKLKIAIQITSVTACFSVSAAPNGPTGEFVKRGLVWSAQTSARINVTTPYYELPASSSRPSYFGVTATPVSSSTRDCMSNIIVQKDGYYGVPIAGSNNNILLVIQNASAKGTANYGGGGGLYGDGAWSSSGLFSLVKGEGILNSGYAWCSTNTESRHAFNTKDYAEFNGTISLYISPDAENKTYTFPETNLIKFVKIDNGYNESMSIARLMNQSTFKLVPVFFNCTISTPPEIAFGEINLWDFPGNTSGKPGGNRLNVLGQINGNFTVNCSGNVSSIPAKLTLRGEPITYNDDLKMTMDADGSDAPASIRAAIQTIKSPCGNDSINFKEGTTNAKNNAVDITLQQGTNTIPYRFSLCSRGVGVKEGAASATATLAINWD